MTFRDRVGRSGLECCLSGIAWQNSNYGFRNLPVLTLAATGYRLRSSPIFKPNYPPGTLAKDRLRPKCVSILTGPLVLKFSVNAFVRDTDRVQEGDGFINPFARV